MRRRRAYRRTLRQAGSRNALVAAAVLSAAASMLPLGGAVSAPTTFRVASTLDGRRALPHRLPWIARPTADAKEVRFLVDGKLRWLEHNAPFSYSDDGGYLVTSWLSPGRHRFTVTATSASGAKASDTVVARVVAPPAPPAALSGRWERHVPSPVPAQPGCGASDSVPAGRWTLDVERRWIETRAPGRFDAVRSKETGAGYLIDNDYVAGPRTLELAGSVTVGLIRDADPRGGWWCEPNGPTGRYSWSVSGGTLTLSPVGGSDPSGQRGGVLSGTWTRAG